MKKTILIALVVWALFPANSLFSQQSKYEGKKVKDITFEGLRHLNKEDLLYAMKTSKGYPLKSSEIREDIRKLFEKGKLERIVIEVEEMGDGVRLRIKCKERPLVKSIEFKGNDDVTETDLTAAVPIKEGEPFRKDHLEKSVARIKKKYNEEGLFNAVVRYTVTQMKGDENMVKITFIIDEGEEIKVRKISILGAKKIYQKEITNIMDTSEKWLFKDGAFKREKYEEDKTKIVAYYKQKGYLDAQILEDSVEYQWINPHKKDKRGIFITIKVSEGKRYFFDGYTIKIKENKPGKPVFKVKDLMKDFEQVRKGTVFNDTYFAMDRQSISFKYATKGYIFTRIAPQKVYTERDVKVAGKTEKRTFVRVDIEVEEGTQAYIDQIIIKGCKKTKEHVVRREVVLRENELFDARKMQLSREKVYNLGFFKQVNIDVRPGSKEGYMNIIVDVEEQPTGTISLGGGYGTTSGFSIFADVGENNLLGYGQRVGVRFEYGPQKTSINLSFNERWLFNVPVGVSTSLFYARNTIKSSQTVFSTVEKETSYKKESIGYSVGLSYRFLDYFTTGTTWTHAFTKVLEPEGNSSDEVFLSKRLGMQEKRMLTMFVGRDSRDNYLNPTNGAQIEFSATFVGGTMLGGDDHYIKYDPEIFFYFSPFHLPFLKNYPCVIELRASGSFITPPFDRSRISHRQNYLINPWLEPEDRLSIGGPETLRGWDYYDSKFPKSWQTVGLFHRILYGAEFRMPIHPRMLWVAVFFDAGSLWSDEFWEKQLTNENYRIVMNDLPLNQNKLITQGFYSSSSTTYGYTNINNLGSSYNLRRISDFPNVNLLRYFRYSYGFGFRIQIPMLPLRFWFGRKLVYDGKFKSMGGLTFQFGMGDMRF